MLVDTDVLIWNLRGSERAAEALDSLPGFAISAVTYMELVQGLRNQRELMALRRAMVFWNAAIVHVTEAISARACFLVEQHALAHSLQLADALIGATALERGEVLLTANVRHYRPIEGLEMQAFVA